MIGLIWNCRGIGQPSVVRSLKMLIKQHQPSFIFLSNIKCSDVVKVHNFVKNISFDCSECIPVMGKSGGLLLAWKSNFNLNIVCSSSNFINCLVFTNVDIPPWKLTLVYGPPTRTMRQGFWDSLDEIDQSFKGPWLIIGDFNEVLNGVDKQGGMPVAGPSRAGLRKLITVHELIDTGFIGCLYTWNNKRSGMANIQERLDRGFSNDEWQILFPEATITHLPAFQSDHKTLQLQLHPTTNHLPKPFRFESMWISHPDMGYIIEEAWNREKHFGAILKHTKTALKEWNKLVFGNV